MPNVQSITESLFETLSSSTPYSIPYSQRPYKWGQDNWDTLWSSIFSTKDFSNFFGTLIFYKNHNFNHSENPISSSISNATEIFDGQQRITTFTILIKAFLDTIHEAGAVLESGQYSSTFITMPNGKPRLNVSDKIKSFFEDNIQSNPGVKPDESTAKNTSEKSILKAYKFFKYECDKYLQDSCNGVFDKFIVDFLNRLHNIEVVILKIDSIELGIEIFESVNATGESLDASELVKNILIKYAAIDQQDLKTIHIEWSEINDLVAESGFTLKDFLQYYWISKYDYVSKNILFQTMKKKFSGDSKKWLSFFDDFKKTVKTLHNIQVDVNYLSFKKRYVYANPNPSNSYKYINYLTALTRIKNKSWIIPIFTILNYELEINKLGHSFIKDKFEKRIEKHFVFCFVYFNILSNPTRDFTPAMYRLAKQINKIHQENPAPVDSIRLIKLEFEQHFKGANSWVRNSIIKFKDSKNEFIEGVSKLKYDKSNNFLLKIIFADIVEKNFNGPKLDFLKNTFEHYLPQNSLEWKIDDDISKQHYHKVGNLLFIENTVNSSLQNYEHSKKLDILKKNMTKLDLFSKNFIDVHNNGGSDFNFGKIDENHLKKSDFIDNPSEIDKRTKIIAEHMWNNYVINFNY